MAKDPGKPEAAKAGAEAKPEKSYARPPLPRELVLEQVDGARLITNYLCDKWAESITITNQIIKAIRDALSGQGKGENAAALAEFRGLLQPAVYARLCSGGDWIADGPNVLLVASDMGTIAGLLSGTNAEPSKNQLKAAFRAVKFHSTCSGGGVGGGAWCTFDWI